jgi:hypothetical protein
MHYGKKFELSNFSNNFERNNNKIIPTRKVSVRTVPSEKYLGKGFSIRAVRIQIKEHPQRGYSGFFTERKRVGTGLESEWIVRVENEWKMNGK